MLFMHSDPKDKMSKLEEDYFGTAKRFLLNEPRELLEIL